jgi:hypothetical protein
MIDFRPLTNREQDIFLESNSIVDLIVWGCGCDFFTSSHTQSNLGRGQFWPYIIFQRNYYNAGGTGVQWHQ